MCGAGGRCGKKASCLVSDVVKMLKTMDINLVSTSSKLAIFCRIYMMISRSVGEDVSVYCKRKLI